MKLTQKKESINFAGLNLSRGKGIISKIKFVIDMVKAFLKSKKIFNEFKADVVIGFGNYSCEL